MNTRRAKARAVRTQSGQMTQPSDYETDVPATLDMPHTPSPRSTEELNLAVLQRHYPDVLSIIFIASYCIPYLHAQDLEDKWVKMEVEGSLFVCQLTPSPLGATRYCLIILNRRGMNNFFVELKTPDDIDDPQNDYVLLQVQGPEHVNLYAIWIFTEHSPSSNVETPKETFAILQRCAQEAEQSRRMVEEELAEESVPMGRQLSLRQLFGVQREQDADWSVHNHHSKPHTPQDDVLGQLFRNAARS